MRLLATLAAAGSLAGGLALAAPAPAAAPERVAIGVAAREYSLSLYRRTVRPGPVRLYLTNLGEDGHDLAVVAPGGRTQGRIAEVPGFGGRGRLDLRLRRRGTYTLRCTIADHAAQGMRVSLRVRR